MTRTKKVLRFFIRFLLALILAMLTLVTTTLAYFLLTERFSLSTEQSLGLINHFLPKDMRATSGYADLSLERGKEGILSKRLQMKTKNFCLRSDAFDICLKDGNWGLSFAWRRLRRLDWKPEITEIEPLMILGVKGEARLGAFTAKETEAPGSQQQRMKDFFLSELLPVWRYSGSHIAVDHLRLMNEAGEKVDLTFSVTAPSLDEVSLEVRNLSLREREFKARGHVDLARTLEGYRLRASARAMLGRTRSLSLNGEAKMRDFENGEFHLMTSWKGVEPLEELRWAGDIRSAKIASRLSLKAGRVEPWVRSLSFHDCDFGVELKSRSGVVRCGSDNVRLVLNETEKIRDPRFLSYSPGFELRLSGLRWDDNPKGDFALRLSLDHEKLIRTELKAEGWIGRTAKGGIDTEFDAEIESSVLKFRRVEKILRETRYAVPAPINTLDGRLGMKTRLKWSMSHVKLWTTAHTDLKSAHQKARLNLAAETTIDRRVKGGVPLIEAQLVIDDLALAAPRYDVRTPPKLIPDRRFGPIESELRVSSRPANVRLRIKTIHPASVRINTNLTSHAVPIGMDIVYDEESEAESKTTGWLTVGTTPVDVFRRQATVEEMRLDFLESGLRRILVRVGVTYNDYDISVFVAGEASDPEILLVSEPPLDSDQILAVLLFGRPLNELADEERSSVTDVEAAFANAALGVASLYYLSRTPIESISYDPHRQRLTAQVGIGAGASIEFGRGADSSVVGFQKRLSREFVFRSDVEKLGTTGEQTVSALVEWVKRF